MNQIKERFSYQYRIFLIFNFFTSRKQEGGLVPKIKSISDFWELQRRCAPLEFYGNLQRIENHKIVRFSNVQFSPSPKERHEENVLKEYKEEIDVIMHYVFSVSPFTKRNIKDMKVLLQSFSFEGEFLSKKYLPN